MSKRSSLDENGRVLRLGKIRLAYGQTIGDVDCPFMKRWVLIHDNGAGLRLHHFTPNHYESVAHDHPFAFITLVIRGGYTDISANEEGHWIADDMEVGAIRYRPARHLHKTRTGPRGAWTIVINRPKERLWGFVDSVGKWIPWMDFHESRAACEDV